MAIQILENKMLAEDLSGLPNLHETIMSNMLRKVTSEWDAKLRHYIQDNLKQFGYTFKNDADFFDFCKHRIHRLSFTENPNYYEFYLDFVDTENKGTFVGSCSDKMVFTMTGNTANVTIGKELGVASHGN